MLALVLVAGCEFADQDPVALVAARGPDTVDCGAIEAWDEAAAAGWARVCALVARGQGRGFRAVISQQVAADADAEPDPAAEAAAAEAAEAAELASLIKPAAGAIGRGQS